jgi:hypothetical protein
LWSVNMASSWIYPEMSEYSHICMTYAFRISMEI